MDCQEWTGARNRLGYGIMMRGNRFWLAHRYYWTQANGPIPTGMCVLHTCDNPPCINLDHLWLGTIADNNKDRHAKGRTGFVVGEAHHRAKLTANQVREARELRAHGWSWPKLGRHFGVTHTTIRLAVTGRFWAHVT